MPKYGKIQKKLLTFANEYDIIIKLSRETRVKQPTEKLENCIRRQTCGKNFMKVAQKIVRNEVSYKKLFQKTSKKYLTNGKRCGTINKLSPRATQTKEREQNGLT